MAEWYIKDGTAELGPFETSQLKAKAVFGEIVPETLVRQASSPKWYQAKQIQGLEFSDMRAPAPQPDVEQRPKPTAPEPKSIVATPEKQTPEPIRATKQCPFCAETILQDAIKCKHCGEFLDQASLRTVGSPGSVYPNLDLIASRQKFVILWLLLQIPLIGTQIALVNFQPLLSIGLGMGVLVLHFVISMSLGLVVYKDALRGVIVAIFTMIPLFGLLALLILSRRATRILTDNGISVGLFGARR